jgi:hypothetical protein
MTHQRCPFDETLPRGKGITRAKFTEDEDRQIRALVARFGRDAWDEVSSAMGHERTNRQLRERWQNYLNPELALQYTETEDRTLQELYAKIGPKWAKIAGVLGRKSAISTRNRHRALQSMRARGLKPDYECGNAPVHLPGLMEYEPSPVDLGDLRLGFSGGQIADSWNWDFDVFP